MILTPCCLCQMSNRVSWSFTYTCWKGKRVRQFLTSSCLSSLSGVLQLGKSRTILSVSSESYYLLQLWQMYGEMCQRLLKYPAGLLSFGNLSPKRYFIFNTIKILYDFGILLSAYFCIIIVTILIRGTSAFCSSWFPTWKVGILGMQKCPQNGLEKWSLLLLLKFIPILTVPALAPLRESRQERFKEEGKEDFPVVISNGSKSSLSSSPLTCVKGDGRMNSLLSI